MEKSVCFQRQQNRHLFVFSRTHSGIEYDITSQRIERTNHTPGHVLDIRFISMCRLPKVSANRERFSRFSTN